VAIIKRIFKKSPITKIQIPNKSHYPIINNQNIFSFVFGYWNLIIGYCLVIACLPQAGLPAAGRYLGVWLFTL
jgi:hypothetical protein